ncbi:integrase [Bifidobacterium lemurum]|uniref:Integrase n=2 Tax=Bifidobacterium lemurum TaxID=1603886 RepID=A0A261FGF2_9BIFI|nr:IS21 family transposase [Bifidobacterium lemurum]OZG58148.1 integrase [Bifidobacterium lemurum]QOL33900.1 IS21 family transposase [Bifidobacterium lemurum]QOL34509.1 IS21 family transposase [Bifidobacterium lemurum]QOL35008.1 IS21 family transposase [Bifidobacterium lemurum]
MTIPMSKQQDIRRLDAKGLPHTEIARRLGVDRGTVAKWAGMEDCSPKPPARRRVKSVLDGYKPLIDSWLEADRLMPRKQRHTAKRVHDRLRDEHGFTGSYSTVLRYVDEWRAANREPSDGYVELEWMPGSVQMDFGLAKARLAGEWVDDHCLVVTFPHSNKRYAASLPAENAECICEGLTSIFEHIGGVPHTLVIDNASGAGHRDSRGNVTLSRVFEAFVSHHRLDVRFCNPYSGNEKGSVENAVGFLRRNLMVPPMAAETHEQLTRLMLAKCDELGEQVHYRALEPIDVLFADDLKALRPLPSCRFDAVRWETRKADKYGCVEIDSNRYQIGPALHGRRVDVAIRATSVTVKDPDGRTIAELSRVYGRSSRTIQDPATVFPLLARKPGAWRDCSIRPDVPDDVRERLDQADDKTLKASLSAIARACEAAGFEPAMRAAGHLIRHGCDFSEADMTILARRIAEGDIDYGGDLPDLGAYDRFNRPGKETA